MIDCLRELAIRSVAKGFCMADSVGMKQTARALALLHKELIFGRSEGQVARMEQERGLN